MTDNSEPTCFVAAYGLIWGSDLPLPRFSDAAPCPEPDIMLRSVARPAERAVLHRIHSGFIHSDGFRLGWKDEVSFDFFHDAATGRSRIDYCPGPAWRGHFPHALYGTVTGLMAAWRGALPVHACAVSIDGMGVLIGGRSGAGKSTLTAGLVAQGAQLVSDDLSVVTGDPHALAIQPGRPAIRLFPDMAAWMPASTTGDAGDGARGKLLVRPDGALASAPVPLRAFILIGDQPLPEHAVFTIAMLRAQLFRPEWLMGVPGQAARIAQLKAIGANVPILSLPPAPLLDEVGWLARARAAAALVHDAMGHTQARSMNQPV